MAINILGALICNESTNFSAFFFFCLFHYLYLFVWIPTFVYTEHRRVCGVNRRPVGVLSYFRWYWYHRREYLQSIVLMFRSYYLIDNVWQSGSFCCVSIIYRFGFSFVLFITAIYYLLLVSVFFFCHLNWMQLGILLWGSWDRLLWGSVFWNEHSNPP